MDLVEARTWLLDASKNQRLAISVITVTEIAGGMRSGERKHVNRLLNSMHIFPVSERIAWGAAELMRKYRRSHSVIGISDYLIAATALVEGLDLITLNIRHFPMFPRLKVPVGNPCSW